MRCQRSCGGVDDCIFAMEEVAGNIALDERFIPFAKLQDSDTNGRGEMFRDWNSLVVRSGG